MYVLRDLHPSILSPLLLPFLPMMRGSVTHRIECPSFFFEIARHWCTA